MQDLAHLHDISARKPTSAIIGVRDGGGRGAVAPPNSGSLSTLIRAEGRDYSGKRQYMFE